MGRYTRPAPPMMRFSVISTEEGCKGRVGVVCLSEEEGFDPLKLESHPAIADIENAAQYLRQLYMAKQACGVDLRSQRLRIELSES